MLANSVEVDRVLRWATPVIAAPLRGADACCQQDALGPGWGVADGVGHLDLPVLPPGN
jgi:hypothetical protein